MTYNVVELTVSSERDQKVLGLRLAGISTGKIGRELGLSNKEVIAALERALPVVDASYRARVLKEELARLDQLQAWWYSAAKTSGSAALLCLRIAERRAQMLGLDAPQHMRLDPIQLVASAAPRENSTAALLRELERVVAEREGPGALTVETEDERTAGRRSQPPLPAV
jgi:hypothetical protein